MDYERHFEQSVLLRNEFWGKIGAVHPDVLAPMINPGLMGGPVWPSMRQSFIKVDTASGTLIASDGLSDPYSDFDDNDEVKKYNGIGCEFFIECDEVFYEWDAMKNSWQFNIVYQAAQLAAGNPNISSVLEKYGYVSTELYDCKVPQQYINADDRTGVLFGLTSDIVPTRLTLSLETIRLIHVKLLTVNELAYITKNGAEGRNEVARLLMQQDKRGKSFLDRKSVV